MNEERMQKFFNHPEHIVDEVIESFSMCYSAVVSKTNCSRTLKYKFAPCEKKVGVVCGGGFGHDPAFMGYIGKDMVHAVAIGDLFSPPSIEAFCEAFSQADSGNGVVCIIGNYPLDIIAARDAVKISGQNGIDVRIIIVNEDVGTEEKALRIGSTGEVFAWKIAGAASALGYDISKVEEVVSRAVSRMRSIGIGLSSCIIPEVGRQNYIIERGTMEIGVGHHGLSSMDTLKLRPADDVADMILDYLLADMPIAEGESVSVMVSGLGNTMLSELYLLGGRVCKMLASKGITPAQVLVGNFFTSLDMMGATLSLLHLDSEIESLLKHLSYPVAFSQFSPEPFDKT